MAQLSDPLYAVPISLTLQQVVCLAHDALMSNIHRTAQKDRESAYKVKLLACLIRDNDNLWEPLMAEISQVWNETAIQRLVNRLDEYASSMGWPICAERHKHNR